MAEPDPRAALAARLREVADRLAALPADTDVDLADAERRAEAVAAVLGEATGRSAFARASDERAAAGVDGFPPHPLGTGACATFPAFEWDRSGASHSATITFGAAFEGPPGTVHGGFVAAAFDMVVSSTATRVLGQAVTRHLRIRYLRPTPLHEPLTFTAEVGEVDGRLAPVVARCRLAGGRLTAKAEGQFASVPRDRFGR